MKAEDGIKDEFRKLIEQKDTCEKWSTSYMMLDQRALALAWVLEHPELTNLRLSEEAKNLYDCLH